MKLLKAVFPFYAKAQELWIDTQTNQIAKGLQKYPKAFDPKDWTGEELLTHALEESVDLVHYLVGLKELIDEKDKKIARLELALFRAGEHSRKAPYMDLDDE